MKINLHFIGYLLAVLLFPLLGYSQAPVANFSANITTSCAPAVIQFTDLSTGNPTSWNWDLGNGTLAVNQNPSTTYINPGDYTVILTATNANGSNTVTKVNYIHINPSPAISFVADDTTTTCVPKTIQFINTTVPNSTGTTTYYWDFGDGFTSSQTNPNHTYTVPGNYTVSLVAVNGTGCLSVLNKNQYIHAVAKPIANFIATNNNSCTAPITATFTNTSTGAISYQWLFGDGGSSTATSPTHTYTVPGSYTVTLIALNNGGCYDTLIRTATVNIGTVTAGFNPSVSTACTGNSILFNNTTMPGAGNSTWYFGDGGTSILANPTHIYTTPGTYTVKLVVNFNNCSDSITHTVVINQGATPQFTATNNQGCSAPLTVNFTNQTIGATGYQWLFGDGGTSTTTSPSNTYTALGQYNVTLITTSSNGCKDTLVKTNYVKVVPTTATIVTDTFLGCAPATGNFNVNINTVVPVVSYSWDFGDGFSGSGIPATHTYTAAGTYTVTFTGVTSTGCTFITTRQVSVGSHITPAFNASPTVICYGQQVQFTNGTTGATSYTWIFGDGGTSSATNPIYTYTAPGTYTVRLVASNNGCRDTLSIANMITVNPPAAIFEIYHSCSNRLTVTFGNFSIGATSWLWDFGDGSTSTLQTPPPHTYAANGTYNVSLTVNNSTTGCTNTRINVVELFDLVASFTATNLNICKGSTIVFNAIGNPNYKSYHWYFGDGTSVITNVPTTSHQYLTTGNYTVSLSVQDVYDCIDSFSRVNYIQVNGIIPSFIANNVGGCNPLNVTFTDQSTSNSGAIVSRTWVFGDGNTTTSTSATISHTYTIFGSYTVKLIATDANGCIDSMIKPNYINVTKPTAAFATTTPTSCLGYSILFDNTSSGIGPLSYNWSFGDGGVATTTNGTHTYTTAGTYTVRLIVTDANGCKDTLTRSNYISVGSVTAGFTMSDSVGICPPLAVNFTNASVGATTYLWDFGNASSSTQTNPVTIYTAPGVYTATLYAYNAGGCVDSFKKTITINGGPAGTLSYSPTSGCFPLTVTFTSTNTNTTSRTWDFSNGFTQTTTGNTVTYTYTTPGVFLPKLILTNGGCSTSVVGADSIKVNKVYAGFKAVPNPVCIGTAIQFTDTSSVIASPVTTWNWNFGDLTTATIANPLHTYATAGTYTVRLITTATGGCTDTAYRTVVINPLPVITATDQTICAGGSTPLLASGAASYSWSPITGLSCTNCANPTASPATTTIYTITGTSSAGCTANQTVTVTVNPLPVVNAGTNQSICNGGSVTLSATGATTYNWSPATGLSCTNCANPVASPSTTTIYTVTGTTNGCSNTTTVTVNVGTSPTVTVTPSQSICVGNTALLTAGGAQSYTWSPATGLSATVGGTVSANPTSTITYTVTGTAANGCTGTAQTTVTVNSLPTINAAGSQTICEGASANLSATGGVTYTWTPATGLSCTSCANPVATPTTTTVYSVTGANANGCTNTAQATITVNPLPTVNASPNQSICNGNSASLSATGAATYVWSPATGLGCTACASPTANPAVTTTYLVTGTNASGCTDTAQVTVTVGSLPSVSGGTNQFICPGGNATLAATGATTYVWTPATGLSCTTCANPVATPATTTVYTVTGTGANGCTGTATVTVTVNAVPAISITGNNPYCAGGSDTLHAIGATTYSWTPATGLSCTNCANPIANPATTTTYTVTGTSGVGCTGTATATITVNPLPTVSAGPDKNICFGTSVGLVATGATTYSWTPATGLSCTNCANPTANPTATTTYVVTGTNASGCIGKDTITVNVNSLPIIAVNSVGICPGGTANLVATGGASYSWSPATGLSCTNCANPIATPTITTAYTVTGTGANGCTATAIATVTVNSIPVIVVSGNTAICQGIGSPLIATGASTYVWSPATGLSCTTCANPVATPAAATTYTVTGTNAAGCVGTTTVSISVHALPVVTAGNAQTSCAGTPVTLTAAGANTYVWTPVTGLSCTNCPNPAATPAGTTTYTVTGTDLNGCKGTANVTVNVLPLPVVNAGPDTFICKLNTIPLQATGAVSYAWSPATGLSCTNCANPIAAPVTTTTYTVKGTGANGCTNTDDVIVNIYAQPAVNAGPDQTICSGQPAQLQASGAATYTWSGGASLSCTACPNPVALPATNTTYQVIGTDVHGCQDSDRVTITVIQRTAVTIGAGGDICEGESFQLSATGGTSYSWSPAASLDNSTIDRPIAKPQVTTTYTVAIQQGQCFGDTLSVTVNVHPIPTVNAGVDLNIVAGGFVTIPTTSTNADTYAWTPGDGLNCTNCLNPVAAPGKTTTYTVRATSAFGCEAADEITVFVTCEGKQLWLPNTFTPNADGQNDRFYPHGKGIATVNRFRIYDRWGELLFDVTNMPVDDANYGWDGTHKNQALKPDVYVYIINAQCSTGEPLEVKGDVSLIR